MSVADFDVVLFWCADVCHAVLPVGADDVEDEEEEDPGDMDHTQYTTVHHSFEQAEEDSW